MLNKNFIFCLEVRSWGLDWWLLTIGHIMAWKGNEPLPESVVMKFYMTHIEDETNMASQERQYLRCIHQAIYLIYIHSVFLSVWGIYIYIYIYREREREREKKKEWMSVSSCYALVLNRQQATGYVNENKDHRNTKLHIYTYTNIKITFEMSNHMTKLTT